MPEAELLTCPYCDGELGPNALSCRCCGRDLVPVLPLLRRIAALETRLDLIEAAPVAPPPAQLPPVEQAVAIPGEGQGVPPAGGDIGPAAPTASRRPWVLPAGFLALLAGYWAIVIWLDLPLAALRALSIALPFAVGHAYLGGRPRMGWADLVVAVLFASAAVAAMNALLGWIDSAPMVPQGAAAWRETLFYALSIGASLYAGMLLRLFRTALSARGLVSIPRLREGLAGMNRTLPTETLKAIELAVLLVGTAVSAITGLLAGLLGLLR